MLLNLAVLGSAIRLLTSAAQRGVQRRKETAAAPTCLSASESRGLPRRPPLIR